MFGSFLKKKTSHEDIRRLKETVEKRYAYHAEHYGEQTFNIESFHKRYHKALRRGDKQIKIFLHAELEAIDLFLTKKQKHPPAASSPEPSATLDVYRAYEKVLEKYPRLKLHQNAFNEIERLYGALMEFYAAHKTALNKIRSKLLSARAQNLYYPAEALMHELLPIFTNRKPKAFLHYVKEVELHPNDEDRIERAGQTLLKKTFHMIDALKQCLNHFLENPTRYNLSTQTFLMQGSPVPFPEYQSLLRKHLNQLLKDFRLTGLL